MTPAPQSQEWIISDKDYHIALEYFHLEARPAPSPETITKGLALELCMDGRKEAAAQARNAALTDVIAILNERAMIDENNQYYLWLEDAECAVESLRTEAHK